MTSTRKNLFVESDSIARSARAFTQNTSVCPCCLPVCTENPIRLYRKIESGELAEALGIIAPRQHHDRPDGHRVGASGALYEAIFGGRRSWDLLCVPCAVGASDPAPSKRSTQMMSFMPTLMQTLRMARLLTILLVPALAACGQSQSQPQASPPPRVTIAKPV